MNKGRALKIIHQNKAVYDSIGNEFADTRQRLWPEIELLVKKYVQPGDKVLDIGCGNGRLLKVLPKVDYWGVDSSYVLLRRAEKLADELDFERAYFKNLDMLRLGELKGNEFDVVFMLASFNHLPSKELRLKVLGEVKKKLRPGGRLIMTNWNMWQWKAKKSVWYYKFSKHNWLRETKLGLGWKDVLTTWQSGDKQKQGELYYRAFTKRELKGLLRRAGFEVEENYYSSDGQEEAWWRAKNIVTVAKLTD